MIENKNIWGKPGCELPNKKLCNACCILPEIELEGTVISLKKSENSPCPNLLKEGEGCKLHLTETKPNNCKNWHCSQVPYHKKFEYVAQAIASGIVTDKEAIIAMLKLIGDRRDLNEVPLIADVFLLADNLKGLMMDRPLVSGNIDEP